MITDEELRISSESYTSKDFLSIYPELLDIIKIISPKWDPSVSNESDPGNVLLKAMAFLADKINYNTDQNVLQNFAPSVSQDSAARNIFEERGYFPKYYQSAITKVKFKYTGSNLATGDSFKFPAMKTVVTDEDATVSYSLMRPCTINSGKVTSEAIDAIQGTFETLTVGGVGSTIQLSDLDDNNRVYFPETMIAQNGVFVYNSDSFVEGETEANNHPSKDDTTTWRLVSNLNLEEPSNTNLVFRVGYDSSRELPYVEFPDNIADLIGSGLVVKYVKTLGSSGNVSANTLTKLISPMQITTATGSEISFELTDESSSDTTKDANNLVLFNTTSTVGGTDPETINDSYNGFKKTVGTFTTLVTCRDYANAIYNLIDSSTGLPYVSNIQVADRRTDINYGNSIVTYSSLGKELVIDTNLENITPFDLCLYPLQPITQSYDADSYINSFKPYTGTPFYEAEIEDLKTISHNYKQLDNDDIYLVKNLYRLNAQITTNYKVNAYEQAALNDTIRQALYKKFNSRNIDYGYEIPFDTIYETIKNADPIIKNVSLSEPVLETVMVLANGTEIPLLEKIKDPSTLIETRDYYIEVLAKNILAGRLSMFDYDTTFSYEFGQSAVSGVGPRIDNLKSIKTEVPITTGAAGLTYTLRENEVIQCIAPNLQTVITYPAYTNFRYEKLTNPSDPSAGIIADAIIPKNTEHKMLGDETLYINYTDSNKNVITIKYTSHSIITNGVEKEMEAVYIKSNFDIPTIRDSYAEAGRSVVKKNVDGQELSFFTLSTNEQIEERQIVARVLSDTELYCYWSTNRQGNTLFTEADAIYSGSSIVGYETLLGEGEYFAYCDESKTEVVIRGSGTKLIYNSSELGSGWSCKKGVIETLADGGTSAFDNFDWKIKNFSTNTLEVHDMQILTLTSGDYIRIAVDDNYLPITDASTQYKAGATYYYKTTSGQTVTYTVITGIDDAEDLASAITTYGGTVYTKLLPDISNNFEPVDTSLVISYKLSSSGSDTPESLPQFSDEGMAWNIRSRLDINCGPNLPQEILGVDTTKTGDASYHRITITPTEGSDVIVTKDSTNITKMFLSQPVQTSGGNSVDMSVTVISAIGTSVEYTMSALVYNFAPVNYDVVSGDAVVERTLERLSGYCTIPISTLDEIDESSGATIDLPVLNLTSDKTLIMFYFYGSDDNTFDVTLYSGSNTQKYVKLYTDSAYSHSLPLNNNYISQTTYEEDVSYYYKNTSGNYILDSDVVDEESFDAELETRGSLYTREVLEEKISIVEISPSASTLKLKVKRGSTSDTSINYIIIGSISKIKTRTGGYTLNSSFGLDLNEENKLISTIDTLDTENIFYYNNPVDKGSAISIKDTSVPQFFWDKNNLYNKFTLGEIDLATNKTDISVVISSQL